MKGSFRDKQVLEGGELVLGAGMTVWEHRCRCGSVLYSVSHWQSPPLAGRVANDVFGPGTKLRTPFRPSEEKESVKASRRRKPRAL